MPSAVAFHHASLEAANGTTILNDLDFAIAPGEAVAFIGRSGAGKTSALRLINGLAEPTRGDVTIDAQRLTPANVITVRRRTGYIIQGSGLFPHRTVYENVATMPRLLQWPEAQTRTAAAEMLERVGLPIARYGDRYPALLSGGEQQRVGIARALVTNPPLLLCDEPFAALDPIVRRELQDSFRSLRGDATIVFVTHDLAEALRIAERVIVFDSARVVADLPAADVIRSEHPLVRRLVESAVLPA